MYSPRALRCGQFVLQLPSRLFLPSPPWLQSRNEETTMKHERTGDRRDRTSRLVAGGGKKERGYASDPFSLLVAALVLLAAAALIAIGMPQALESTASHAYASTAILTDRGPEEDQPPQAAEEETEPFIVDDVRTEGVMDAFADVFCPIEC
jgi:hypothetical protein